MKKKPVKVSQLYQLKGKTLALINLPLQYFYLKSHAVVQQEYFSSFVQMAGLTRNDQPEMNN